MRAVAGPRAYLAAGSLPETGLAGSAQATVFQATQSRGSMLVNTGPTSPGPEREQAEIYAANIAANLS